MERGQIAFSLKMVHVPFQGGAAEAGWLWRSRAAIWFSPADGPHLQGGGNPAIAGCSGLGQLQLECGPSV